MPMGKTIVSTPVDEDTLKRLDALCAGVHRTRAEVLRGLLYSLLIPEKHFIIDEWREIVKSDAGTPA
ncbi:MAG TPA: hypothetical protein VGK36_20385 [Candidatus Angelobacter sp.]|jgi:hypothetical protein